MTQRYSDERNVLIVVALLKAHGIRRVVVSPGSTNVTFVGSVQCDPWFQLWSCVDERSAAYLACGMAAETREPVVLSCTGATASRNYYPALTEAHYRHLPVLAVTSTQEARLVGQLHPQVTDRTTQPRDTVLRSEYIAPVRTADEERQAALQANRAILELTHRGGGPAHINLATRYSPNFDVAELPQVRKLSRHAPGDPLPALPGGRIAFYIGSTTAWDAATTEALDRFCEAHNAVAFCAVTAGYHGRFRVNMLPLASQVNSPTRLSSADLLIHLGDMSEYYGTAHGQRTWRVHPDGELADPYGTLTDVFEMRPADFLRAYAPASDAPADDSHLRECQQSLARFAAKIPPLPFSHLTVAQTLAPRLPKGCALHLGILSALRSWSFFQPDTSIDVYCNEGGFGIDGNMSSLVGASLANPDKLFFGVVGDLSFFYDMNILGNRHIGPNVRLLLINNGTGGQFHLFTQLNSTHVDDYDAYLAAGGHFGRQSRSLVRHLAEDLGYEYHGAASQAEVEAVADMFADPGRRDRPMIVEVFTDTAQEDEALHRLMTVESDAAYMAGRKLKDAAKEVLPGAAVEWAKKLLGRG